jgi:GST-like protein
MIELYYWPTPNGHKITMMLEETGLAYRVVPVNIARGEQFEPDFLAISPNNKMPAMIDREPGEGSGPLSLFESGAILQYLAEKSGQFLPADRFGKYGVLQWLFWQMAHLGPMLGQQHHFRNYAPERIEYAVERYQKETERLYGVLEDQLEGRDFIAGDYSIADMACYPWVMPDRQGIDAGEFPNIVRWQERIRARPAVKRAYAVADDINAEETITEESKKILFGQGRRPRR